LRVELDDRNEKVGFKIREAEVNKVPYMIIIGDQEINTEQVSVRKKGEGDIGKMKVDKLMNQLLDEIKKKN